MLEGVGSGDRLEAFAFPGAERSAGSGEDDLRDFLRTPLQALEDRRMLAVHRNDLAAVLRQKIVHKIAGFDHRFLIGKPDAQPRAQRIEHRLNASSAGDGADHAVDAREAVGVIRPEIMITTKRRFILNAFEIFVCGFVGDEHVLRLILPHLFIEQRLVAMRRQNVHLIGSQRVHDLQRLGADGPCGTKDR